MNRLLGDHSTKHTYDFHEQRTALNELYYTYVRRYRKSECPFCGTRIINVSRHIKTIHTEKTEKERMASLAGLKKKRNPTKGKLKQCDICDIEFVRLERHQKRMHTTTTPATSETTTPATSEEKRRPINVVHPYYSSR
ncbi:uncharacterized protein [Antedon mediterranea]|uniref:uncharacterized protein n=1 Tax=Antedon mediterranea TaxID=105859 RepID=UPI003AF70229